MRLQDTIDDMDANIRKDYDNTFADIYIQHEPEYKVVVKFARTIPPNVYRLISDKLQNDVILQKIRFSLNELEKARSSSVALLEKKGIHAISDIDTPSNMAILSVDSSSAINRFSSVEAVEKYLISLNPMCTAGFTVLGIHPLLWR